MQNQLDEELASVPVEPPVVAPATQPVSYADETTPLEDLPPKIRNVIKAAIGWAWIGAIALAIFTIYITFATSSGSSGSIGEAMGRALAPFVYIPLFVTACVVFVKGLAAVKKRPLKGTGFFASVGWVTFVVALWTIVNLCMYVGYAAKGSNWLTFRGNASFIIAWTLNYGLPSLIGASSIMMFYTREKIHSYRRGKQSAESLLESATAKPYAWVKQSWPAIITFSILLTVSIVLTAVTVAADIQYARERDAKYAKALQDRQNEPFVSKDLSFSFVFGGVPRPGYYAPGKDDSEISHRDYYYKATDYEVAVAVIKYDLTKIKGDTEIAKLSSKVGITEAPKDVLEYKQYEDLKGIQVLKQWSSGQYLSYPYYQSSYTSLSGTRIVVSFQRAIFKDDTLYVIHMSRESLSEADFIHRAETLKFL